MRKKSPSFSYWDNALRLELLLLMYVRSIRTGDFELYKQSISKILGWCFILDHTHYARWLSVHLRDMVNLQKTHPDVYDMFMKGFFVVNKTNINFSMIGVDHNPELKTKSLKKKGAHLSLTMKKIVSLQRL